MMLLRQRATAAGQTEPGALAALERLPPELWELVVVFVAAAPVLPTVLRPVPPALPGRHGGY